MFGGGGLFGGFPARQVFEEQYHCFSVAYANKEHLEVSSVVMHVAVRYQPTMV